ncbi:MAG TPA: hypothetical protein VFB60_02340 [Ktedonobacteraceae bacterium]|nr:hypothetical protein [Ktedonobacteraceae bacterium]
MEITAHRFHFALSVQAARAIGAEPRRCWRNALLSIMLLPEIFADGRYVEGWLVVPKETRLEIVEHGWLQLPSRELVDPSLVLTEKPDQPACYFAGYTLSRSRLAALAPGGTLPLVCHSIYGDDGMSHREYRHAYTAAWQRARELAHKHQLPESTINEYRRTEARGMTLIIATENVL